MKLLIAFVALSAWAQVYPSLPQQWVDTSVYPTSTNVIRVGCGEDLQAAITKAAALPNADVRLANCTWVGSIILPARAANLGWAVVQPEAGIALPPRGTRMSAAFHGAIPRIVAGNGGGPAISNDNNNPVAAARLTHHWWFTGIELYSSFAWTYHLMSFSPINDGGVGIPSDEAVIPHHIVLDRLSLHGKPEELWETGRAVIAYADHFAIIDSYMAEFHKGGMESQALLFGLSHGPFKVVNNFISAACENIMVGGNSSPFPGVQPSDFEIRHNHFYKNPLWRTWTKGIACYKNLFELKSGSNVLLTDNLLENSWHGGQQGTAFVLGLRSSQSGLWLRMRNIIIANNLVENAAGAFALWSKDNACMSHWKYVVNVTGGKLTITSSNGGSGPNYCSTGNCEVAINGVNYSLSENSVVTPTPAVDIVAGSMTGRTPCGIGERFLLSDNVFRGLANQFSADYPSFGVVKTDNGIDFTIRRNSFFGATDPFTTPALYLTRHGCLTDMTGLFFDRNVINAIGQAVTGDCVTQSPTAIFGAESGVKGTNGFAGNRLYSASALTRTQWTAFDPTTTYSANQAALGMRADKLAFLGAYPGAGANLGCFNEAAVRAGTPSAYCPLPVEVAPVVVTVAVPSQQLPLWNGKAYTYPQMGPTLVLTAGQIDVRRRRYNVPLTYDAVREGWPVPAGASNVVLIVHGQRYIPGIDYEITAGLIVLVGDDSIEMRKSLVVSIDYDE